MLGSIELMNSRRSGSEEMLATLACKKITDRREPHILVAGLGMGFTLRAVLAALGDDARVNVAELVPSVVAWARGPMAEIFGGCLEDPRVRIIEGDVGCVIKSGRATYDAILLDVDNGPEGLTRKANDDIYGIDGLRAAHAALRPGGMLAVWASAPNRQFANRLNDTGFTVDEVNLRANGKRGGARHVIWIATNDRGRHRKALDN
ncbi:MAG TPA: spermidine synthase [Thermohalobaculum sp.]|nr:spermidine synthase [Thermohalobaculum sp.]